MFKDLKNPLLQKIILLVIILLFISYSVCSQTNFDLYTKSINCFNTGDYVCSKQGFKEILGSSKVSNSSIFENAQFYLFLSSLSASRSI